MLVVFLWGSLKNENVWHMFLANQFKIPVKFIGVGEKAEDLLVFNKQQFVSGLFPDIS